MRRMELALFLRAGYSMPESSKEKRSYNINLCWRGVYESRLRF